jgi:hypothetical protein
MLQAKSAKKKKNTILGPPKSKNVVTDGAGRLYT